MSDSKKITAFLREYFQTQEFIPLHEPRFRGKEKDYLSECIDSTFVSYLGKFVPEFEKQFIELTKTKFALSVSNGTSALHMAMIGAGVEEGDEVLTQALSFVATGNAILYCGASPIFLDIDSDTLGLSYGQLRTFLEENVEMKDSQAFNKKTNKRIRACVPVHIFGHPVKDIDKIVDLCHQYNIQVVEDSAESLGSYYKEKHTGTFGDVGVFSFNGNKIVTCGGGGMIITDNEEIFNRIKHISTTAKKPHKWEYFHDELGFNVRMPNLNAAVACAQMENLNTFLKEKRELASKYIDLFKDSEIDFFQEKENSITNYWLNAIIAKDRNHRDQLLEELNSAGIMSRPAWTPLNELPHFQHCQVGSLDNVNFFADRLINIPSSARSS